MCDTILAPPASTAEHFMLFGKNSDRQRNEAQGLEHLLRAEHAPGATLACTYITIPQARHTHAVLLSRPFWIWGAEMGANEHGVVIGNEGLHARSAPPEKKALTGMDILRIGLERASTAAEALQVMTQLLEEYGQGGDCGHLFPGYYHNGYLIADPNEAFVLETVGREWMAERVRGVRTISNGYTIGQNADRVSAGLPALIRDSGWSDSATPHYAEAIGDPNREHIGHACARRARSTTLLQAQEGQISAADMMATLRDHGPTDPSGAGWSPERAVSISLCMHAAGPDRNGQTAGSIVSQIHKTKSVHWVTGTAAPCTSIFKPVLFDVPMPAPGPLPTDRFDARALWWRHERLHRAALLGDFAKFLDDIRPERDALEADFRARVAAVLDGGNAAERSQVVAGCWKDALELEDRWVARVAKVAAPPDTSYNAAWLKMNRIAGMAGLE